MAKKKKNPEGRVNVPLGSHDERLGEAATKAGLSKTNLARILILDGLEKILTGEWSVRGPGVEVRP